MKNRKSQLVAELKALTVKPARLTDSELLETLKEVELAMASMSLADYDDNAEKHVIRFKLEDVQSALSKEYQARATNGDIVFKNQRKAICNIVEYYRQMRNRNDEIIRAYEHIGGTNPDAFDAAVDQMEKDAAPVNSDPPDNGLSFDLQAHADSVEEEAATVDQIKVCSIVENGIDVSYYVLKDGIELDVRTMYAKVKNVKSAVLVNEFTADGEKVIEGFAEPHSPALKTAHWLYLLFNQEIFYGISRFTPEGKEKRASIRNSFETYKTAADLYTNIILSNDV